MIPIYSPLLGLYRDTSTQLPFFIVSRTYCKLDKEFVFIVYREASSLSYSILIMSVDVDSLVSGSMSILHFACAEMNPLEGRTVAKIEENLFLLR